MKKALIVTFIVLGVAAAGVAIALNAWNTDPKVAFFKAEMKNMKAMGEEFTGLFRKDADFFSHLQHKAVRFNGDLGISIDTADLPPELKEQMKQATGFLSKLKSDVTLEIDKPNKKMTGAIKTSFDNETLLSGEVFVDNTKIGLFSKEVYDRYFTLDGSRFGAWMKTLNPSYAGPEKLELFGPANGNGNPNEDQWNEIAIKYGKLLYDQIRNDQITVEKTELGGRSAKAYTLKLTKDDIKQLGDTFKTTMKNDEALHKLLSARFPDVDWGNVLAKSSDQAEDDALLPKEFSIKLIVDGRNNMLKHEWTLGAGPEGKLSYVNDRSSNDPYWQLTLQPAEGSKTDFERLAVTDHYRSDEEKRKEHALVFEMKTGEATTKLDAVYVHYESGNTANDDVTMSFNPPEGAQPMKFVLQLQYQRSFAKKDEIAGTAGLSIDVASTAPAESFAFKVKYQSNIRVAEIDQVKLPDITSAIDLIEMKEQERSNLNNEIQVRLQRHFESLQQKFMQAVGSFL